MASSNELIINGIAFNWGIIFEDALEIFPYKNSFWGYSVWLNFEFECNTILGLDSITCCLRGPRLDRPVTQISFELKPIRKKIFESHHSPYLKTLKKLFGEPHRISVSKIHNGLKYNEKSASGSVIYNCKWWLGDVLVSLSVYGGIRSNSRGLHAAGLYFDWMNEERAAEPFIESFLKQEEALSSTASEIRKQSIEVSQLPYHRSHYELDDPHLALKNQNLRACQMVLYTNNLFRLPQIISNNTKDNEIGIFYSKRQNTYCVFNKWDFTPITNKSKLEFITILPARGGGAKELRIDSLVLSDEKSSNSLDKIKAEIEELAKVEFKSVETYDD